MPTKKKQHHTLAGFSDFLDEPMIAASLLVLALIALVLSILEFGNVML